MSLWTSQAAEAATGGTVTTAWECKGVSIDTRTIEEGDLFVALTAARDGVVAEVMASAGAQVSAGDILIRLEDEDAS